MPYSNQKLKNKISILIYCPEDKTFLLLFDEKRGDYWIPSTDMDDNLSWKENLLLYKKELIDFDTIEEKLLKIYKIWTLKKEVIHLLFQMSVSKEVKMNCKNETAIGIIAWYSCSEIYSLRPLLRSIELLEALHIYKPIINKEVQNITGETFPIGSLFEIRKTDVIVCPKNTVNTLYLDLLSSADISQAEQCEIYDQYFTHTYPCIYMNYTSFERAMQPYCLLENIASLFRAADLWKRKFLTFRDFLYLLAVMDPLTSHYGNVGEIRCQYIFRYYNENQDGKLKLSDINNILFDIELKKNPKIGEKELEKLIECRVQSLNLKQNILLTFTEFYKLIVESKIQDTSLLLRFSENFLRSPQSECSDSVEKFLPSQLILPFSMNFKTCHGQTPSYSIVIKTTILKPNDSPLALRDFKLFEGPFYIYYHGLNRFALLSDITANFFDTMTKSVLEDFKIHENLELMKNETFDLNEKINELFNALKYFSTEVKAGECVGESDIENKPAYCWGSANIDELAVTFILICEKVKEILSNEPRLLEIQPPVYVMGDLHGNFHDLMCFEKTLWRNGIALSPAKMLFLGDYVDRGMNGVEVLMYLFASKVQNPDKFFLVRGNHEIREIQKLFTFQRECNHTFGEATGVAVWKAVNDTFDMMPLAAVIDHKVFCCHGGIPPPWLCPLIPFINTIPKPLVHCERQSPLAWTLMWNDPLKSRYSRNSVQQLELLTNEGFAPNLQRGTGFCFSCCALDKFLLTNDLSHVIRAHEVVKAGFQIHQKGKLLTVFSSSNYCGGKNYAGTVLVADNLLRVCMVDTERKSNKRYSSLKINI